MDDRNPLGVAFGYLVAGSSLLPIPSMVERGWDVSTLGLGIVAVIALVLGIATVRSA